MLVNNSIANMEDTIREKVQKYKTALAEGLYISGSFSEKSILKDLYLYATRRLEDRVQINDVLLTDQSDRVEYGLEILEVSKDCLSAYSEKNGDFIKYFNYCLKRRLSVAAGKEVSYRISGGMHIPEAKAIALSKARKRLEEEPSINQDMMMNTLGVLYDEGEITVLPEMEDVVAYLGMKAGSLYIETNDGEEVCVVDNVKDASTDDFLGLEAKSGNTIDVINREFRKVQERSQACLRDMLTVYILKLDDDAAIVKEVSEKQCLWFNQEIYIQYKGSGMLPLRRDLSAVHGRSEQSLSRTFTEFLDKVRRRLG